MRANAVENGRERERECKCGADMFIWVRFRMEVGVLHCAAFYLSIFVFKVHVLAEAVVTRMTHRFTYQFRLAILDFWL